MDPGSGQGREALLALRILAAEPQAGGPHLVLARGREPEAKGRYSTARARLERYGLGLRLPLLKRKLDAIA